MKVSIKFEPRDLWLGIYWNTTTEDDGNLRCRYLRIYLCIVPLIPIIFTFRKSILGSSISRIDRRNPDRHSYSRFGTEIVKGFHHRNES